MDNYLEALFKAVVQKRTLAIIILLMVLTGLSYAAINAPVYRWGDGSTYYMQELSIVNDHDIQYTWQDIQRIMSDRVNDVPAGMYLIKTADGRYFFGKDFTFALFASPFFALIGGNGILLFNALLLFCMILMGYLYLKKDNGILASGYAIIFFLLSTTFVYMFWANPDLYDAFLIMLGLFIWVKYTEKSDVRYLAVASLVLGLAAVSKAPDAVVFIPVALFELYKRRFTNLAIASGAFLLSIAIFCGYFYIQSGTFSFYGGDRLYYSGNYPFWDGYNSTNEAGSQAFSINAGNTISDLVDVNNLKIIPYNLFYYFFGRFTGMLWYFPLAIFALVSFVFQCKGIRYLKEHPEKLPILGAITLYILAYAVVLGDNYLGGGWAVGNRYFYIYPAFIFLLDKVDLKKLAVFLVIAFFTVLPLVMSPIATSNVPYSHTTKSPYTYFPLDMSQLGNLPMEGSGYQDNFGNTFTVFGSHPGFYEGSLVVSTSDMLIQSSTPIQRLNLSLLSDYNHYTGNISYNGFSEVVPISGEEMKTVTITGMKPIYSDSRQYVYEVKVVLD